MIDLGLGGGASPTALPTMSRGQLQSQARDMAKQCFRSISKILGIAEAQRIFLAIATPPSKALREDFRNSNLLTLFISKKWPIQRFAKYIAKLPTADFFVTRGGISDEEKTEARIQRQITRLLKNKPAKGASLHLLILIDEARKLPRLPRGRPRKKNGCE